MKEAESLVGKVVEYEGERGVVLSRTDSGGHRVRFTVVDDQGKKKARYRVLGNGIKLEAKS